MNQCQIRPSAAKGHINFSYYLYLGHIFLGQDRYSCPAGHFILGVIVQQDRICCSWENISPGHIILLTHFPLTAIIVLNLVSVLLQWSISHFANNKLLTLLVMSCSTFSIHSTFVNVSFTYQSPFTCKLLAHTCISNTRVTHMQLTSTCYLAPYLYSKTKPFYSY